MNTGEFRDELLTAMKQVASGELSREDAQVIIWRAKHINKTMLRQLKNSKANARARARAKEAKESKG